MTTAAGISGDGSGSTGQNGSSGISGDSGSKQTTSSELKTSILSDIRASAPDRGNHLAFALLQRDEDPHQRLWPLVMETCPLPLLQHWREPVMEVLTQHQMLTALSISPQGRVRYQLKTPWRNGTTHVEWDAVDFIAKLAALVPPPRTHLTRFHGVFAPNANLRPGIEQRQLRPELPGQ